LCSARFMLCRYQQLAFADDLFAQKIFGVLAGTVVASDRFGDDRRGKLGACLASFFESSPPQHSSVFVDAMCELAIGSGCAADLDASHVRNRCAISGILQHGVMLLENQITSAPAVEPSAKRRRQAGGGSSTRVDPNDSRWSEVAALYKGLGDEDALASINAQSLGPRWRSLGLDDVPKAFEFEAESDFAAALTLFDKILKDGDAADLDSGDKALLEESRSVCALQLCQWGELANEVPTKRLMNLLSGAEHNPAIRARAVVCNVQHALGQVLAALDAASTSAATSPARLAEIIDAIDEALKSPDAHDAIASDFAPELALLFCAAAVQGTDASRLDLARFYAVQGVSAFCSAWNSLHPLMKAARQHALQQVQALVEIREIIDAVAHVHASERLVESSETVLRAWSKRSPASDAMDECVTHCLLRRDCVFAHHHSRFDVLSAPLVSCSPTAVIVCLLVCLFMRSSSTLFVAVVRPPPPS
jgi:hypothetical protein